MVSRIWEFPISRKFPEPREIPITREFPRLKLFPLVSRETRISRESPDHGFPLNITAATSMGYMMHHANGCCTSIQLTKVFKNLSHWLLNFTSVVVSPQFPELLGQRTCHNLYKDSAGRYRLQWHRDVQREIPIPSLMYGFKLFPPGKFPYGHSREVPKIRE